MSLDPQLDVFLQQLAAIQLGDITTMEPEEARTLFASLRDGSDPTPVDTTQDRNVAGPETDLPIRIYRRGRGEGPVIVYFHGGGWVLGDLETHDELCRLLCARTRFTVVSVAYRLAPESQYPGPMEDAYAALSWVARRADRLGVDASRIIVAGDSAGGNLATAAAMKARDEGTPGVCFQLLLYPVTDHDFSRGSYQDFSEGYFLSRAMMEWFWDHYCPEEAKRAEGLASPLRSANLSDLPPTHIVTAGHDPLRDEGLAYAQALSSAGVETTAKTYPSLIHGFGGMTRVSTAALTAVDEICTELKQRVEALG